MHDMKRWTLILVALLMVVALSSLGSVVATASKEVGGKDRAPSAETTVRPSKAELEAPRPPRPADFGQMEVRKNGEMVPLREVSAQATSAPQWIDGPASLTHYNNIITGTIGILTNEWVGYWGATDVSYP